MGKYFIKNRAYIASHASRSYKNLGNANAMECVDLKEMLRRSDELVDKAAKALSRLEKRTYDVVLLTPPADTSSVRRRTASCYKSK